jgi:hypothetical protein
MLAYYPIACYGRSEVKTDQYMYHKVTGKQGRSVRHAASALFCAKDKQPQDLERERKTCKAYRTIRMQARPPLGLPERRIACHSPVVARQLSATALTRR